ncbi:MAG: acyltransferase family protein [Ruminococcus sp.]|nr:acyltransferase family protein [Ruminococcus sp.]
MSNKERIIWIDIAKGLGILLVILQHLEVGLLGKWISTFNMPLFFFLSGYVFSTKYDFVSFVKRKCKTLLIPYVFLGMTMVVFQLISYCYYGEISVNNVLKLLSDFVLQRRLWTLWFITCLFLMNIIFYLIVSFAKSFRKVSVIIAFLTILGILYYRFIGVELIWNLDVCFTMMIFFYAGYYCKVYKNNVTSLFKFRLWILPLALAGNILFSYLSYVISGSTLVVSWSLYGFEPFTFISAFFGVYFIIILSMAIRLEPIRYIGENSLIYFAWHQTLFIPVTYKVLNVIFNIFKLPLLDDGVLVWQIVYQLSALIIILLAITVLNLIISRSKFRFTIGK